MKLEQSSLSPYISYINAAQRFRWLLPVLFVWGANHFLRLILQEVNSGRIEYLINSFNPFDNASRLWAELIIVGAISYIVHRVQRPGWWPAIITALFFLLVQAANYFHYAALKTSLSFRSLQQIPELFRVLPVFSIVVITGVALIMVFALCLSIRPAAISKVGISFIGIMLIIFAIFFQPSYALKFLDTINPPIAWRQPGEFIRLGTWFTLIRNELQTRVLSTELNDYSNSQPKWPFLNVESTLSLIKEKRNIHVILLESHLDPNDFFNATYNQAPWDIQYREWRDEAQGTVLSGFFGGSTANVEFEVLCGVPAYNDLGPIAFNSLAGAPVPCLPQLLQSIGYSTTASSPDVGSFFNRETAYKSIGFEQSYFVDAFDMSDLDGWVLSNDSSFQQSLGFISKQIETSQPVFNYTVSIGGHLPFTLNEDRRPPLIQFPEQSEKLNKVINHSYYTSKAVVAHMQRIQNIDPDSIVIFFSDHAPSLPIDDYRRPNYLGIIEEKKVEFERNLVPVFIFNKGEPVFLNGAITHYMIPEIIVNLLSEGEYCLTYSCLSKREHGLRPPFVFERKKPKRHYCFLENSNQEICSQAKILNKEMLDSFFSLIAVSRLSDASKNNL